ncbi:N-acetyltransferase [Paenibacillaceae bacterium]|nr:N-acetyltransferase [Paenibacillaceae bacterium]
MIQLSHAKLDDMDAILKLQKSAYQSEAALYDDYSIAPLHQTIEGMIKDFNSHTILKAQIDSSIVGSVRAIVRDGTCHIGRLIVADHCQNQGIGQRLMREIEVVFTGKCQRFELFTGDKSIRNLYLYRKLGFEVYRKEYVNDNLSLLFLGKEV